jgi:hypothetical protein
MRTKDKIEKYLDRLCKKYNGRVIESEKSRYYTFNNRTLRVSNHVSKNSSGSISIVFDGFDPGNYIICGHNSGNIFIINYEHLKVFVKNFIITCYLFKDCSIHDLNPTGICSNTKIVVPSDASALEITANTIRNNFSKNQICTMKNWLGKNNKLKKLL